MLFAVNGGSDTIAVFWINADGSLTPVEGSPFPSGGSNPVSVGLSNDILCVVNQDQDPGHPGEFLPNYTSFRVSPQGQSDSRSRTRPSLDDLGSYPSQALISPDGSLLFGADFLGGLLRSFQITENGRLIPAMPSRSRRRYSPAPARRPYRSGWRSTRRRSCSTSISSRSARSGSIATTRRVSSTSCDRAGSRARGHAGPLVNEAGTRLYASNTGDSSVSVYDISRDPTAPVEIQHVKLKTTGNCFQFALDSTEKFLHVVTQGGSLTSPPSANGLNVLSVAPDGTLTEVPSSPTILPVPPMVRPQGVAAL